MASKFCELAADNYVVRVFTGLLFACAAWWFWSRHDDVAQLPKVWIIAIAAALLAVLLEQLVDIYWKLCRFYKLEGSKFYCFGYAQDTKDDKKNGPYIKAAVARNCTVSDVKRLLKADDDLLYPSGSIGKVSYVGDTTLRVTLTEYKSGIVDEDHRLTWTGNCVMESDEVGIMEWAYEHLGTNTNPWRRNGVKRLHVVDGNANSVKICIATYNNDERFGREILVKAPYDEEQQRQYKWLASAIWTTVCLITLFCFIFFAGQK
jgi:hypothetical protein